MPSDKKKDDDNGMSTSGEIRRQDQYGEQGKSSGQKEREAAQKERESERERDSGVEEDRDG